MKTKVFSLLAEKWQLYVLYASIGVAACSIMWVKLFKLIPYASAGEVAARESASSLELILRDPLFLPHKLAQFLAFSVGFDGLRTTRFISTLFALLAAVFFYRVIRTWLTPRVGLLATSLFISSSWFLHAGRIGTPIILYTLSIALLWAGLRLKSNKPRTPTLAIIGAICTTLLFVPGFIWFIGIALFWQRKKVLTELKRAPKKLIALLITQTVLIAGILGYAFVQTPKLALNWLGLPTVINFKDAAFNLLLTPYHLFVHAPGDPELWLGRLAYISVSLTILFGLGVYVLYKSVLLDRMRAIAGAFVISAILASFGLVPLLVIMPFIFVAIATGLALLLQQWFTVFPKNPIARSIGVVTVVVLVGFSVYYNAYQYFVAWPRNPETKQTFTKQIP